jgi:hypothetical protein
MRRERPAALFMMPLLKDTTVQPLSKMRHVFVIPYPENALAVYVSKSFEYWNFF